ncbi:MAG: hypothetical protein COV99_01125 [Bacteroidetes bacterium CG12_big_fil_rev_8_21_14_0_65_60_17]|nr:MAG: hypothetical protein COV99_01125 [Bacteroidetes bacterium CG12_big_fil_rev_8_21_14_0_65_60_17]
MHSFIVPGRGVVPMGLLLFGLLFLPTDSAHARQDTAGGRTKCLSGVADGYACDGVDLLSRLAPADMGAVSGGFQAALNDIWGWTDAETGMEVAIVGRTNGTSFVDVTDPANPGYLGNLPLRAGTTASAWRDIKVHADHAYIVADNASGSGVQIFDLRQLKGLAPGGRTFTETAVYDGISRSHNVAINEDTGFLYVVGSGGSNSCGGGLHMVDISEPTNPVFAGCFADPGTGRAGTGYVHDAQCVIYSGPDSDHTGREICFGLNETHVSIVDVTDKNASIPLARTSYPNVAYVHQGWLSEDQRYFFQGDELDEQQGITPSRRTLIWDVSDLDDPVLAAEYFAPGTSIDHNMYVVGTRLYQSNYVDGLQVLDISDPENPVQIGFFDTQAAPGTWTGSWSNYPFFRSGAIAVSSSHDGLFMVQESDRALVTDVAEAAQLPQAIRLASVYPNPFQDATTIQVDADRLVHVRIFLIDVSGREVLDIHSGELQPGTQHFRIPSAQLSGGAYFVRLEGEGVSATESVILLK